MDRPSHLQSRIHRPVLSRTTSSALAVALPFAILWALAHQHIGAVSVMPGPLTFIPDPDKPLPRTPAPEPVLTKIAPVTAIAPLVVIDNPSTENRGGLTIAPAQPSATPHPSVTPPPDRAAAGIASTHTSPPYPALSQRMGEQGIVTLRLTVETDGHVGKAAIVTSSGSTRLDEAAQSWIVAHWLYKPAQIQGQPAQSDVTASVRFNLADMR